jgi:putative membrane protein
VRKREWIQGILLVLLGLFFLDLSITGRVYYYINERFGWLVWVASFVFLLLGSLNIVSLLRTRTHTEHDHSEHEEHHYHDHNHVHSAPSWVVLGILAFPLMLGILVPARPLSAAAIGSDGVGTSFTGVQGGATQLNIAPTERNVLDWIRAFNSTDNLNEFSGQPADLIGFVYRDIRLQNKPLFMVARFTVSCCTADASAIGVRVLSDDADKFAQDSWVHVTGKFSIQDIDGTQTPVLIAENIEPTDIPDHPYLYP